MLYLIAKTLNTTIVHLHELFESALYRVREGDLNMCKCTKTFHCVWYFCY